MIYTGEPEQNGKNRRSKIFVPGESEQSGALRSAYVDKLRASIEGTDRADKRKTIIVDEHQGTTKRRARSILEKPPSPSMHPRELWPHVVAAFPYLGIVRLQPMTGSFSQTSAGVFRTEKLTIECAENGTEEAFEELMQSRRRSAELVAERLGIDFKDLNPHALRNFIFLHECGHADQYIKQFFAPLALTNSPHTAQKKSAEAFTQYLLDELKTLPIPKYGPVALRQMYAKHSFVLPCLVGDYLGKKEGITDAEIERVISLQEKAYKNLPSERHADDFAVRFLKKLFVR